MSEEFNLAGYRLRKLTLADADEIRQWKRGEHLLITNLNCSNSESIRINVGFLTEVYGDGPGYLHMKISTHVVNVDMTRFTNKDLNRIFSKDEGLISEIHKLNSMDAEPYGPNFDLNFTTGWSLSLMEGQKDAFVYEVLEYVNMGDTVKKITKERAELLLKELGDNS